MEFREQIKLVAAEAQREFLAGLKGAAPSPQELADVAWAAETIAAGAFLSMGGNPAGKQAEINQVVAEAHAILRDYGMAHAIDAKTLADVAFRKVLQRAFTVALTVAVKATTGISV